MSGEIRQGITRSLDYLAEAPWVAYLSIVLLQVKVMLWVWEYRDLTPGDTSSYYFDVFAWLDEGKVNLLWSPIYTGFLAILHRMLGDPYWVLTVTRILVACCGSLLVLALLRRLLPKPLAWLIAAWWALLPINFDTIYSVHLFSALFPLALFVVAAYANNIYGRGIVLAGLLFTALLVRNEYSVLFMLWLLAMAGYEVFVNRRKGDRSGSWKNYLLAYGLPAMVVLLIAGLCVTNATHDFAGLKKDLEAKHEQNVCQIYAFNKGQQGEWKGNPWTDCQGLLEQDFGQSDVTFSQAFLLNPEAILKHIWWNFKLIPSGIQLALFDVYAGGPNPDYIRAKTFPLVWVPFFLVLGLCTFAAIKNFIAPALAKRRFAGNGFVWLLMVSAAAMVFGLMLMQRPRPSYMFPLSIFIMALTGLGLNELFELLRMSRAVKILCPLLGVSLILLVPPYYDANYVNALGYQGQELLDFYQEIAPNIDRATVQSPAVLVTPSGDYSDLCNYTGTICRTLPAMGSLSAAKIKQRLFAGPQATGGRNVYFLYTADMIWNVPAGPSKKLNKMSDYVELNCFSLAENLMTCSDGTIDLSRGVMNDGKIDIPLRSVLFVDDGFVVKRKNYSPEEGYFLEILMNDNQIEKVLVADDKLFRTKFNQRYLLGNFDKNYFTDLFNDFPEVRILKMKTAVGRKP